MYFRLFYDNLLYFQRSNWTNSQMIYDPNSNKEKLTHEPQPPPSKHLQTTLAHLHGKDDAILFAPDVHR